MLGVQREPSTLIFSMVGLLFARFNLEEGFLCAGARKRATLYLISL